MDLWIPFQNYFHHHMKEYPDTGVQSQLTINFFYMPFGVSVIYLLFVCVYGPKFMKNRDVLRIDIVILMYYILQIIINLYLCMQAIEYVLITSNNLLCITIEDPGSEHFHMVKRGHWIYLFARFLDLFNTVFFVLQKKQRLVSFLHVYHHVMLFNVTWYSVKYIHGGLVIVLFGVLNTFEHAVMDTYYLLSILPKCKKFAQYLKKSITQSQIAEFFICAICIAYSGFKKECSYNVYLVYILWSQFIVILVLYYNFYRKTYNSDAKIMLNGGPHAKNTGRIKSN